MIQGGAAASAHRLLNHLLNQPIHSFIKVERLQAHTAQFVHSSLSFSPFIKVERLQAYTSLEPEPGWVPPNAAAATSAPPLRRVAPTLTGAGGGGEGGGEGGGGGVARFPASAAYLPEGGRGSGLVLRDLSLRYRDGRPPSHAREIGGGV